MRNRTISSRFVCAALLAASLVLTQNVLAEDGHKKLNKIEHIIVVYQENWSFDSLYGLFPGANGLAQSATVSLTQRDRLTGQPYSSQLGQPFDLASGSVSLTTPPQPINNDVSPAQIDTRFPAENLHFSRQTRPATSFIASGTNSYRSIMERWMGSSAGATILGW